MMEIQNICKSFRGEKVLDNISFTVNDGETVLISAPSGSGKTTLLRIMMGLENPDSGKALGLPDKISAVFQEDRLPLEFTALQCVRMTAPKSITRATIAEHLTELGLGEQVSKPVSELSGGMKRRVAVCRAILCDFDMLFMDEPFTGLDTETKLRVIAYIKKYTAGKTAVFVSHDDGDAELLGAKVLRI